MDTANQLAFFQAFSKKHRPQRIRKASILNRFPGTLKVIGDVGFHDSKKHGLKLVIKQSTLWVFYCYPNNEPILATRLGIWHRHSVLLRNSSFSRFIQIQSLIHPLP